jgi:hypothetical protein
MKNTGLNLACIIFVTCFFSCSNNDDKSVLNALVSAEESIQITNAFEYARGEEKKAQLEEMAIDVSQNPLKEKVKAIMIDVDKIEKMTSEMISFLDQIKFDIMVDCGESITKDGKNPSGNNIVSKPYDKSKTPCKPTRMNLMYCKELDKINEPMSVLGVGKGSASPSGNAKIIWEKYNQFRNDLTDILVKSTSTPEKAYSIKTKDILEFKDVADLGKKVDVMFKSGNVPSDEFHEIKNIYISLSKNEINKVNNDEVHWVEKTWGNNPQIAALLSLSILQREILTARAEAISLIRSRIASCNFSFNKVMALAAGPLSAKKGEEVELKVLMTAFSEDKQPVVTVNGGKVKEVKDGVATIVAKVIGGSEMKLSGTISIAKKSGEMKTENWEHVIKIAKP